MKAARLDAFGLRDDVVDAYREYVAGFIRISDARVREEVERSFEAGEPWPDPWVQINPNYRTDADVDRLIEQGTFTAAIRPIFSAGDGSGWKFYAHQVSAFERAAAGRSYVMTTGTGSGKSMTYMAPIIDHVLRTKDGPGDTGIRAIIIYPMNALANSQLEELRKFLPGGSLHDAVGEDDVLDPSKLTAPVTYARYTGQDTSGFRRAIIERPPDILLTNYVMLELLLTRVHDRSLLADADRLRFIVLDELHTYRGRQGADVALLMRRLAHGAGRGRGADLHGKLIFVGTSATMASDGSPAEQRATVANVAGKLFGAAVGAGDVIGETVVRVTDGAAIAQEELTAILRAGWRPHENFSSFAADPLARWVESRIGVAADAEGVQRRATPGQLTTLAKELAAQTGVEPAICLESVRKVISNGDTIQVPGVERSAFPFRLHQFVSRGEEVYASLESPRERYITLEEQQFVPGDRNRSLFNLAFCRECGADYHPVERVSDSKGRTFFVSREIGTRLDAFGGRLGYLYVGPDGERWPRSEGADRYRDPAVLDRVPVEWVIEDKDGGAVIDPDRRRLLPEPIVVDGNGVETGHGLGLAAAFIPRFRFCMVCGVEYGPNVTSDLAKLGRLGMSGRSTATTMLTLAALRHLSSLIPAGTYPAKLLSFTDNVQDASLQAGHFNDFVQVGMLRGALYKALGGREEAGLNASDVAEQVLDQLDISVGDYAGVPEALADLPQGEEARRTMLRLLRHRLFVDLAGGYRLSQPNLENVGLLRIDYDGLDEVCALDAFWIDDAPSASRFIDAAPKQRRAAAQTLLDYLRRNLILAHDAVDADTYDALKTEIEGTLVEPWDFGIDRNSDLTPSGVAIARARIKSGRNAESTLWRFLTMNSAFGRWLSRRVFPGEPLRGEDLDSTLNHLVEVLRRAKYLKAVGAASDGAPMLSVNGLLIRWRPGDGTPIRDPLRVPRLAVDAEGDALAATNAFFRRFYEEIAIGLAGLEAREHTAQVTHEDRITRERRFREGELEVLFCSPTMELGIDISDLNVVGMRNVPPTPANYAQRSGRAGRSGQAALVMTYCSTRSPHDQFYFRRPQQMVSGVVAAPHIDLHNEDLIRSHVQAIWLAETGANLGAHMLDDVLDMERKHRHAPVFTIKKSLRERFADPSARDRALAVAEAVLNRVEGLSETGWWVDDPSWVSMGIARASEAFWESTSRWREMYRAASIQADQMYDAARAAGISQKQKRVAEAAEREAKAQLDLLQSAGGADHDFNTYRYFASEGFLPGYSFPRLPISAFIGQRVRMGQSLPTISRPRFLAITEFGPQTFIYHNGSRYRVTRVMLPIDADTVRDDGSRALVRKGRMCISCGHHYTEEESEKYDRCVHCDHDLGDALVWNNLFRMASVATRKVERISSNEEERQRLGYEVRTGYTFARRRSGQVDAIRAAVLADDGTQLVELTYAPTATLTRLNLGWSHQRDRGSDGFHLDLASGRWVGEQKDEIDPVTGEPVAPDDPHAAGTTVALVVPFVEDRRNALVVRPGGLLPVDDEEARAGLVASLQSAIAVAIRQRYQLEESELASVPLPTAAVQERDAFLLYEAAEGGAGVLRRLVEDPSAFAECARIALERCHFIPDEDAANGWRDIGHAPGRREDCEAACYDCLLSYGNQMDHRRLDRKDRSGSGLFSSLVRITKSVTSDPQQLEDVEAPPAMLAAEDRGSDGGPVARADHARALRNGCSSGTERAFLDLLDRQGRRLPTAGQRPILDGRALTDFLYQRVGVKPAIVFIDGHPHCESDQQDLDRLVTEDASDAGHRVIRFRACTQHHPESSSEKAWVELLDANADVFGESR